jgi:hypothetical protein
VGPHCGTAFQKCKSDIVNIVNITAFIEQGSNVIVIKQPEINLFLNQMG